MPKRSTIRLGAIENAGPNTLMSHLKSAGSTAVEIDIAVAFVTAAGLDSVLYLLKKAAARGRVRLLTGLYQGFTEPKALGKLLREQQQTDGRLAVQVSLDPHFHWKAYFLAGKTNADVIIGSSNLTDDGLRRSGEFNVVLPLRKSSKQFQALHDIFERHWSAKSKPLTDEALRKYEAWRASAMVPTGFHRVPVSKILGSSHTTKPKVAREVRYWRTCVDALLSEETLALLREITDWDKKGYGYFATEKPFYQVGDRVVFFDFADKNVCVIEIKDTTSAPPPGTSDGVHFAAYKQVKEIPLRKLIRNRWKYLRASGLIRLKRYAYFTRSLSAKRFEQFVANLRQTAK
jgi:HKD family nuclease